MLDLCCVVGVKFTFDFTCEFIAVVLVIIAFFFFAESTCLPGQFRCQEGTCIPSLAVCNYQKDCDKGDDELQGCCKYSSLINTMNFLW